eukprot:TRINITY_DN14813_c0_g1_i8.p1 TRINITY_DN14813_c0_g1~~TRINITY_DN14813_c0_g1_i8.p1  ORF type:complete len:129 (-),score=16.40 TRINITY_DN14813_c0_g1_i8:24-410(-)
MLLSFRRSSWSQSCGAIGTGKDAPRRHMVSKQTANFQKAQSREVLQLLDLGQKPTLAEVQHVLATVFSEWNHNPRLATAVLSSLAKQKRALTSLHVLDAMHKNQLEVNTFHYNSGISACEKGRQWCWH